MQRKSGKSVDDGTAGPLELPEPTASMSFVVYRLEAISKAIHQSFEEIVANEEEPSQAGRLRAYAHFRSRAYRLLSHYIGHGFQEAFRWLLGMQGAAPKRSRIPLHQNPFHWGLLAVTAAGGPFMSPNRLRELASDLQAAHAAEVPEEGLESFLQARKRQARRHALSTLLRELRPGHRGTFGE
jgi:hypothetical protein